jgi:hypothetical protein
MRVMFGKRKKKTDRIVNIDKEKYEINSLHSCYDFICKEIFGVRLSKNQYKSTVYTHNSYNMFVHIICLINFMKKIYLHKSYIKYLIIYTTKKKTKLTNVIIVP